MIRPRFTSEAESSVGLFGTWRETPMICGVTAASLGVALVAPGADAELVAPREAVAWPLENREPSWVTASTTAPMSMAASSRPTSAREIMRPFGSASSSSTAVLPTSTSSSSQDSSSES